MEYNYSIIIPHHNIPDLLNRCLNSIPVRDDVQIIVVDDASDSDSLRRIEDAQYNDRNIQFVYSTVNGGGGMARNLGLTYALGKYVIFCDADDFFTPCLDTVLNEYKSQEFDIAFFKGCSSDTDTYLPSNRANHLNRFIDSYLETNNADSLRYIFGEPWCKIISRSLITENHIRFDETKIHNDTTFSYLVGYHAKLILADPRAIYCVTTRKGSVSLTLSDDRIITRVQVYGRAMRFFKNHGIKVRLQEHYVQIVRLLAHGQLGLAKRCCAELVKLGYTRTEIDCGCLNSFINIIIKRI